MAHATTSRNEQEYHLDEHTIVDLPQTQELQDLPALHFTCTHIQTSELGKL